MCTCCQLRRIWCILNVHHTGDGQLPRCECLASEYCRVPSPSLPYSDHRRERFVFWKHHRCLRSLLSLKEAFRCEKQGFLRVVSILGCLSSIRSSASRDFCMFKLRYKGAGAAEWSNMHLPRMVLRADVNSSGTFWQSPIRTAYYLRWGQGFQQATRDSALTRAHVINRTGSKFFRWMETLVIADETTRCKQGPSAKLT